MSGFSFSCGGTCDRTPWRVHPVLQLLEPNRFLDSFLPGIARARVVIFTISSSVRGARCTGDGVHVWGGRCPASGQSFTSLKSSMNLDPRIDFLLERGVHLPKCSRTNPPRVYRFAQVKNRTHNKTDEKGDEKAP